MPVAVKSPAPVVDKRRAAIDARRELMVGFLDEDPELATIYSTAFDTGDQDTMAELDDLIAERLGEEQPNLNQFEITPEEKRVVPQRPGYPSMGQMIPLEQRMRGAIEVIPAVNAPLYSPSVERLYDFIDNGLRGNLRAKPGSSDYIENDLATMYAGMVRERTPSADYSKHKHYYSIRQRLGEQLAAEGISSKFGFAQEKAEEFIRGTVPFIEDFPDKPEWFPGADKAKQERVTALMELADESTAGFQMGGKITGLLLGGANIYAKLSKMGMTKFIGMSNVHKAKSFLATATAEVGIDMAYNPNGHTMVIGALMDEDQSRILSGVEAIALGTAFNLGIDGIRALKGKKLKQSIVELQKQLGARGDFINVLRKRVAQGEPEVPAKEMVKQPPIEIHFPKEEKLAPMRPEQSEAIEATVVTSNAKTWQRVHELEEWNKELATKHSVHRIRRNLKEIKAMKEDMGILDVESQLRANQLADDAIQQGAAETSADAARRINLPEQNLIDMDDWIKQSAETAPMREMGGWSKLAYRDGLMHGVAAPMGIGLLGGGLAMSQADEDKVGAFMAGMMLPVAPKDVLKRFAQGWRQRVPGKFGRAARYAFVPFRSSVNRISRTMGEEVLRHRLRSMTEANKKLEDATVFFGEMNDLVKRRVITQAEKETIYQHLDNGKRDMAMKGFDVIEDILTRAGHKRGADNAKVYFNFYEQIIRDTWTAADDVGLHMGFIKDYFPRQISDKMYKKFIKDNAIVKDSRITAAWKAETEMLRRKLTKYEKSQIANNVLNSYGHGSGGKPGFTKTRHFKEVPPEMRKYYDSFEKTSIQYITQMTDAVNLHKWLGVGLTKNRLREVVEEVEVAPGVVDKSVTKVRKPKFEGEYNYRETIGNKLSKAMERDGFTQAQKDDLTDLLHSRYATPMGRPAPEWLKIARDMGYMLTIGNPYSTITQLSDVFLAASLSERGMGGTVFEAAAKRITGGKLTYTLADFNIDPQGLERLLVEFQDEALTTAWLRGTLKHTGFSWADVVGKETLINATWAELRNAAKSAPHTKAFKRLSGEYRPALGDEFDDFVDALRKGKKGVDSVMAAIFGRLLDQHPAALDEMPLLYIKHPWARSMYALKSFTLKQIDLMRKRTFNQLTEGVAKGDKQMIKDAVLDSVKYTILFGGSVQGVNWIKDFLLGREVDISDRTLDGVMQLIGLQRYHIEYGRRQFRKESKLEALWGVAGGFITPPAASILYDTVRPDVMEMATGEQQVGQAGGNPIKVLGMDTGLRDDVIPFPRARTWKHLPFLGKDIYWSLRGREHEEKRQQKPQPESRTMRRPRRPQRPAGR